uniref:Dipeptidylpeptidase IV N-terminal domain-containing protein n=1 Tax=Oryza meridionalis TaxID=40149 RepID=A0A0E0DBK7_9ORYZ
MEMDMVAISLGDDDDETISIKKLTVRGENNAFPSPPPDGKWLVFRSGRSGAQEPVHHGRQGRRGRWHPAADGGPMVGHDVQLVPDDEWIAFASDRHAPGSGSFAIMVHPNGTGLRRVVHSGDGGRTNHPWFSSDSTSLVFTSDYAAVSAEPVFNTHHYQPCGEIYTLDIDGSNIRRLTHNSFEDGTPSWTPYFLDPRDVGETLQASGRCAFQDCHWLNIEDAQPEELIYGKSC